MKKLKKNLAAPLICISILLAVAYFYIACQLPNTYFVTEGGSVEFSLPPFSVSLKSGDRSINATSPLYGIQKYNACLNIFNFLPIKTVQVSVVPKKTVSLCGSPFGVKIYTDGVMIIDITDVKTSSGSVCPGKDAGLQKGDVITGIGDQKIYNNDQLESILINSTGENITINAVRENKTFDTVLKPEKSVDDGTYRAGIWVRDSSAGIGTLTFCEKGSGAFSGLGHGICDVDTGELLRLLKGEVIEATITDTVRGTSGFPGELKGCFINAEPIGELSANTEVGLYGKLKKMPTCEENSIEVAMKQDIKKGPAKILTTIEGYTPEYFDINIDSINYNVNCPTKNMMISIKDKELFKKTGGIVQGMSGSPVIQNGKLVGAVTHVFVNDPSKGYAIFAETMLTNSNNIFGPEYKKVS